jgi:hypothetical protein
MCVFPFADSECSAVMTRCVFSFEVLNGMRANLQNVVLRSCVVLDAKCLFYATYFNVNSTIRIIKVQIIFVGFFL